MARLFRSAWPAGSFLAGEHVEGDRDRRSGWSETSRVLGASKSPRVSTGSSDFPIEKGGEGRYGTPVNQRTAQRKGREEERPR